jgi:hypothetical protein
MVHIPMVRIPMERIPMVRIPMVTMYTYDEFLANFLTDFDFPEDFFDL